MLNVGLHRGHHLDAYILACQNVDQRAAAAWIYAGGGHHTVVTTALDMEDIRLFVRMTGTELVVIDDDTDLDSLRKELELNSLIARLR